MADKNKITIEVEVDEHGKASAALKTLEGDVLRFTAGVNRAGGEGHKLRDIFSGNLLADFFQRGIGAAVQFGAASVQASAAASDSNRVLEFSATQAGLSYTRAADMAEDFGKRVGQSNTEAARTLAELIRLADKAGQSQNVDLITGRFADLAAARGIPARELSTIAQQIAAGTSDEALNKLGLADPGKLYQDYAAAAGKTAESLTEVEKAQARLNPLLQQAAAAEGEAETRLRGTAGQLDTAASAYQNLQVQAGEAITTSVEFRDVLDTISDALGSVVTSHAEARRELSLGLKSPEQIAQAERDGLGRQAFNAFKGGASFLAGLGFDAVDFTRFLAGQISAEELRTNLKGTQDGIYNPGQRQYEARVAQLRALKEEIERQEGAAETNAGATAAKTAAAAQRSALQKQFGDSLEAATKDDNLSARLDKLKELKEQLKEMPGVLDAGEFEKRSKKIDEAIEQTSKQVAAAVRTARDAVRDLLGGALAADDKENPFVELFVRARDEAEETRRKFLIFGEDFANVMARVREESIKTEIVTARFQSSLQALKYLQEARRLDLPLVGSSGPEERRLAVVGASITGIEKEIDLARRQAVLENPYRRLTAFDAQRQSQDLLGQLLSLDVSGTGRAGREAQAQGVLNLLGQFDPRTVATSPLPFFRQLRDAGFNAYQVQRDALKANVEDAVLRERAGNLIQQDARELLAAVSASGLRGDGKLKEFLAVTGALSEQELTPDLRRARAGFLREAAQAESRKEAQAEERARLLSSVMTKLDRLLTDRGVKVDAPPSTVSVNVGDGLSFDRALLGEAPGPELSGVTPGVRTIGSDF